MAGIFLDTNILIYPYDSRDHDKQEQAIEVVDLLTGSGRAVLSVQCLTEFFNTATRRLPESLTREEALVRVERLAAICTVLPLTAAAVLEGCRGSIRHGLHHWDGLIWAVAKLNDIPIILTEDMAHGRAIDGVRYFNPFLPEFDLDRLARKAQS